MPTDTALFASGCFWGTQYHLSRAAGVVRTTVGYTGGHVENPTYEQVCAHGTGHVEAVKVEYDPEQTTYEALAKLFFETHDPTQRGGQGPDHGSQYLSVIFYTTPEQQATAERLIGMLREKGMDVATELRPAGKFWPAEAYHQEYYDRRGGTPYCHTYRKREW
jgi:peptide methionine sulfoxide reductase msrA/msrB